MAGKKVEAEIAIDATPEEVWRAISEGDRLKQWFPLDARVTPPPDGKVWLSWGEGAEWESPIEVWEPSKHLRTVDVMPGKDGGPATRIAVLCWRCGKYRSLKSIICVRGCNGGVGQKRI